MNKVSDPFGNKVEEVGPELPVLGPVVGHTHLDVIDRVSPLHVVVTHSFQCQTPYTWLQLITGVKEGNWNMEIYTLG